MLINNDTYQRESFRATHSTTLNIAYHLLVLYALVCQVFVIGNILVCTHTLPILPAVVTNDNKTSNRIQLTKTLIPFSLNVL